MNIRRIEYELFRYRSTADDLEEIKAEMKELKSYERPKKGQGKKPDIPDIADAVVARDYRMAQLKAEETAVKARKAAIEAAFKKYAGHEYLEAVKRVYIQGQSVRLVAKDMRRDWRTVDRHAKQLLCQIGATLPGVGHPSR